MTSTEYFPAATANAAASSTSAEATPRGEARPELMLGKAIEMRVGRMSSLTAALLGIIAFAAVVALWFGHFSRSESVRGVVTTSSGYSKLESPRGGVVTRLLVAQGDTVTAGTPIAVLALTRTTTDGETTAEAEARALARQRINHQAEMRRADVLIEAVRREAAAGAGDEATLTAALAEQERTVLAGLELERATVRKLTGLVKSGYATNEMLDQHRRFQLQYERDLSDVRMRKLDAVRSTTQRRREIDATLADRTAARDAAENQISNIDSRLSQLRAEGTIEVVAQTDGKVLTLAVNPGDSVASGQLLAAIGKSDDSSIVVLDAPASAIGLAKVGQRVVLKYDAFPFKSFGVSWGTVTAISSAAVRDAVQPGASPAVAAGANGAQAAAASQSIYRVEVKPDKDTVFAYGQEQPIAIGSTLTAEIVVERRRLIDWVIDPIRAMEGRT